jgi:dUTP pyrophosphatase
MQTVYVKKLNEDAKIPEYMSENAVGADVTSIENVIVPVGKIKLVKTGLAPEIPNNLEIQVRSRSGLAAKNGVFVLNSPGTIDPDYTGEIGVILANFGEKDFEVKKGDRIAQLVISEKPLAQFKEKIGDLKETERGSGGFGHTGVK